ncbi:unnamed protein product, partial [Echinostoma caproni]|uniref:J domain-containing protein n=1 Tax=Echinostoma caproni TaxID=27848 RepID=A0A183BCP1_9TREM
GDISSAPSDSQTPSATTGSQPAFTKSQADAVRRVLACKNYYDILGVSRDSSEDQIRRAYKNLALKFHPDKNRAPGATEAFKKIGTALNVLTDTEKRRRYDQFGTEEEQPPRITRVHRHGDAFFQYDGKVAPTYCELLLQRMYFQCFSTVRRAIEPNDSKAAYHKNWVWMLVFGPQVPRTKPLFSLPQVKLIKRVRGSLMNVIYLLLSFRRRYSPYLGCIFCYFGCPVLPSIPRFSNYQSLSRKSCLLYLT